MAVTPTVVPSALQKFGVANSQPRAMDMPRINATTAAIRAIITTQKLAMPSRGDMRSQPAQESAAVPTMIAASGAAQMPTKIDASHFIVVLFSSSGATVQSCDADYILGAVHFSSQVISCGRFFWPWSWRARR
jgi:hypothetical protein